MYCVYVYNVQPGININYATGDSSASGTNSLRILDMLLRATVAALWAGKVLAYLMENYYDSKATYEKLFDWTDEHKFKTGKYSYKEAVIDELATASPSEYLTKISIQVF